METVEQFPFVLCAWPSTRPPAPPDVPTTSGTGFPSRSPTRSQCSSAMTLRPTAPSRAGLFTAPVSTQPRPTTLLAVKISWSDPLSSSRKTGRARAIYLEITGVTPAFELSDRSKGFECTEIGQGEIPAFTLALGDCQIMMDFVAVSRQDWG